MGSEANKRLVRRFYEEVVSTGEVHRVPEFVAAECVETDGFVRVKSGVEDWLGMKPTGRALVFTGVNVDHVVDGKIVEHGGAANMLLPFLEVGAIRVVSD